jgi:hypothetical protein
MPRAISQSAKNVGSYMVQCIRNAAAEDAARGAELTDPKRHMISGPKRVVVDADCDYTEWGNQWSVFYTTGAGQTIEVTTADSYEDAEYLITTRCAALTVAA